MGYIILSEEPTKKLAYGELLNYAGVKQIELLEDLSAGYAGQIFYLCLCSTFCKNIGQIQLPASYVSAKIVFCCGRRKNCK
jgi:hypothetical protein